MYAETLEKLSNAAFGKKKLIEESVGKYFLASVMAGLYVGLGIFLIMTIGGLTKGMGSHFRIFIGLGFGIALSLVLVIGSELFTGNNMIMTAGLANKKVSLKDTIKVWGTSYIGNLVGSTIVGMLYVFSGVPKGKVGEFIVALSKAKMSGDPTSLFFKGVLCNILVCLAVLAYIKMKSESGKLIMIFWCLFAFITSGYEHSIANMSIFTAGLLLNHGPTVSLAGYGHNMLWVTLGNVVGGGSIGLVYWYMGRKTK